MIVLFTDFGLQGPYTGQMKAVLQQMAPGISIIDLFADAPAGNPKGAAYLLAAYAQWFAAGTTFLCVVDPGVGGTRPPVVVEADDRWYVGPGNGLFELIARRAAKTRSWDIDLKPQRLSASFHGRDLFAPVAAMPAAQGRYGSPKRLAGRPRRDRLRRSLGQRHDRLAGGGAGAQRQARRRGARARARADLRRSPARRSLLVREFERACGNRGQWRTR